MKKITGISLVAMAACGLILGGCNNENKGFATVNGSPITNAQLLEYLETKPTVRANVNGQPVNVQVQDTLAFQALQELVIRNLLLQLAKEENVNPTPQEVEDHIKTLGEVNPGYVPNLTQRGLSMKGIREQITYDLAQQNLVAKGITVSDKEVEDYIKANPQEFEEPAKAEMFWIVANGTIKPQVDAELARGSKFGDVAVKYSLDPEAAANAGKFGANRFPAGVPMTQLAKPIFDAVTATAAGKTTGWVDLGQNGQVAKFSIVRKTEARKIEVTPARKKLIKRAIQVSRGRETKDIDGKIAKMLQEAKIEVTDTALNDLWKKFDENLKKQASQGKIPSQQPQTN
jgi:hypothetical protein